MLVVSVAESTADRTALWSSLSADSTEAFSLEELASSLANRLKTVDGIPFWVFDRRLKGDDVVIDRGLEMKEVDGEVAARNAARRMRCL